MAARWRTIAVLVCVFKILLITLLPPIPSPWGDLWNWAYGAAICLGYLERGHFPTVAATGIYGPLELVLVPFYWLWTKLPIEHPAVETIGYLYSNTTPARFLVILLNVPLVLADIATGLLVLKLVKRLTQSDVRSKLAFLLWYANPYNVYITNVYSAMDVIPTSIFLLALILAYESKWFRCGLYVSFAAILRVFSLITVPFLILGARTKATRMRSSLLSGVLLPLLLGLLLVFTTGAATLEGIATIPQREFWLLDFLGPSLISQYVRLAPYLVALQLGVCICLWKKRNLLHLATVSLLALTVGTLPFGGGGKHFLWVSPLLTICLALNPDELWVFVLTFFAAALLDGWPAFPVGANPR